MHDTTTAVTIQRAHLRVVDLPLVYKQMEKEQIVNEKYIDTTFGQNLIELTLDIDAEHVTELPKEKRTVHTVTLYQHPRFETVRIVYPNDLSEDERYILMSVIFHTFYFMEDAQYTVEGTLLSHASAGAYAMDVCGRIQLPRTVSDEQVIRANTVIDETHYDIVMNAQTIGILWLYVTLQDSLYLRQELAVDDEETDALTKNHPIYKTYPTLINTIQNGLRQIGTDAPYTENEIIEVDRYLNEQLYEGSFYPSHQLYVARLSLPKRLLTIANLQDLQQDMSDIKRIEQHIEKGVHMLADVLEKENILEKYKTRFKVIPIKVTPRVIDITNLPQRKYLQKAYDGKYEKYPIVADYFKNETRRVAFHFDFYMNGEIETATIVFLPEFGMFIYQFKSDTFGELPDYAFTEFYNMNVRYKESGDYTLYETGNLLPDEMANLVHEKLIDMVMNYDHIIGEDVYVNVPVIELHNPFKEQPDVKTDQEFFEMPTPVSQASMQLIYHIIEPFVMAFRCNPSDQENIFVEHYGHYLDLMAEIERFIQTKADNVNDLWADLQKIDAIFDRFNEHLFD